MPRIYLAGVMIKFLSLILLLLNSAIGRPITTEADIRKQKAKACAIYQKAYPDCIKSTDGNYIIWHDGTKMPISDGREANKSFQEKLDTTTLLDQLEISYINGFDYQKNVNQLNYDPGRLRNTDFFKKMYGSTEEEVKKNLVTIKWLPNIFPEKYEIPVTKINSVAERLKKISEELEQLVMQKPDMAKYLKRPGGTFCWRVIAGTGRPSAHSFGMTIDINVEHSNYWLWDYKHEQNIPRDANISEQDVDNSKFPAYRNAIPREIVEIFEKYGFIWGGKWYHYDTMHFEYRPELFLPFIPN